MNSLKLPIQVCSEIGQLKTVLVHTPGDEIYNVAPCRLKEFLFAALIRVEKAQKEHQRFIKILEDQGVKIIQLTDLLVQTYNYVNTEIQVEFIQQWIREAKPVLSSANQILVFNYLKSLSTSELIQKMITGIFCREVGIDVNKTQELLVDPIPNLTYTRDPFFSVANGICFSTMKHLTRKREALFANFIFRYNPTYHGVSQYLKQNEAHAIEGGDVLIYDACNLIIGVSERTDLDSILKLGVNLQACKENQFKRIIAIKVPVMKNLMHLDTWLTMVDYNKFLYSPNLLSTLKIWEINLTQQPIKAELKHKDLQAILEELAQAPITLIPVGGYGASQLVIDIETHFDATNYLVIKPGVVVGYDRNQKTEAALKAAGVEVLSFDGDQLSLGMGSARCMSMPLYRERIKPFKNK